MTKTLTPLIKAEKLTKTFGAHKAVDEIDFEIHPGEIVGFLGPNGAGKTTTIRMLLNILSPTSGSLTLFGLAFHRRRSEILRRMNASSGSLTLPGKLSVGENLNVFSDLYGVRNRKERIRYLSKKFDLESFLDRSLYALSSGQQVRVSLAKAFLNSPQILLLDEPTASLDPDVADRVRTFLMNVVEEEGTTVFLTSHNMNEVSKICSRVLFLNHGKIEAEGTPRELARRIRRSRVSLRIKKPLHDIPHLRIPTDLNLVVHPNEVTFEADQSQLGPFLTHLAQAGVEIDRISILEPTLEDFFVHSARRPPS